MTRRRVQWSQQETEAVCREYHLMHLKGELCNRVEDSWRVAQQRVLKEDRWKAFNYSASATELNKVYKDLVRHRKFIDVKPVVSAPAPAPIDPSRVVMIGDKPVLKETYEAVVNHHKQMTPPPIAPTFDSVMRALVRDELMGLMPTMLHTLATQMSEIQEQHHHRLMKHIDPSYEGDKPVLIPEVANTGRERKPTIVVCNAQPAQMQSLERTFPQFEFHQVQDKVPAYDHPLLVLGFERFMNRPQIDGCKRKYGDAYLSVLGSASDAKERMKHRLQHLSFEG
jgi:hypothetical protein